MNFIPNSKPVTKYKVLYPFPTINIRYKDKKSNSIKTVDLEMNIDDLKNTHTTNSSPPKYISFDFDKRDKIQGLIGEGYDIIGCGCSEKTQSVYKQKEGKNGYYRYRHLHRAFHQPHG